MSFQDSARLPVHYEEAASSDCIMTHAPKQSSFATQQTTPPIRVDKPPSSSASFLSLAPELRNEVYRYLLTLPGEIIDIGCPCICAELHTSIICTNRQISQEAAAIFYGENSFVARLDYIDDYFRVDKEAPVDQKAAVDLQLGETPKEGHTPTASCTRLYGYIYPHVFARIRYLEIDVKFSCCSRRYKVGAWDFHPDWVAASLKTAVDALMPGSALREFAVGFESLDMGKEVPTREDLRVALEPLRALKGILDVWIIGSCLGWDHLFVARLIWDMMESGDGEA